MKVLLILFMVFAFAACQPQKTIIPHDIFGTWNYVDEKSNNEYNLAQISFNDSNDIGLCPILGDTVYHYERYNILGDTLLLYDRNNDTLTLQMEYLGGDSLMLKSKNPFSEGVFFIKSKDVNQLRLASVHAIDLPEDSCDIIVKMVQPGDSQIALSRQNMLKAKAILKRYFEVLANKKPISNQRQMQPLPFSKYIRQYWAETRDGHLMVFVSMMTFVHYTPDRPNAWYYELMRSPSMVNDGGKNFVDAIIDLTTGQIVQFYVHGEA